MPSRAWVVTVKHSDLEGENMFQCPHGLELLRYTRNQNSNNKSVNALMGLSCYNDSNIDNDEWNVCQCPHGLELLRDKDWREKRTQTVSMPSWAWVVTARMSNILNFSWYFLCIPAIYKCILAYLPIFFNQLSKFLRCESPSTFLGTCLSHHSFIIFLVTSTNTLFSGLYLISTVKQFADNIESAKRVNALSGLYLISTVPPRIMLYTLVCFNALMGLSCYEQRITGAEESISFNALTGLSCYDWYKRRWLSKSCFNALMGLSCYLSVHTLKWWSCVSMPSWAWVVTQRKHHVPELERSFNALMGLSCYGKNVQYFKFFMILFMHPCYL